VLERTLGVPIFQEQVIELAMVAAGFSGGEADQLRRAIGAWRSSKQLESFRQRLIDGMLQRGYQRSFAEQIFKQIKGFGEYGFPESHSASFALIAYVSAWLKCHYPAAFTCALLNSQPMGFYAPAQLVQDAQRHGVEVLPTDVCHSDWKSTLEADGKGHLAIRLGLHRIRGLSESTGQQIAEARGKQVFASLHDLYRRIAINKKESEALAAADALHSLSGNRHQAGWSALACLSRPLTDDLLTNLPPLPEATVMLPVPAEGQEIVADYRHTGLSLRRHPLALLRPKFERYGWLSSHLLENCKHHDLVRVVGLVINRQHPNAGGTIFLTLEDEYGCSNIVVWRSTVLRYQKAVVHGRLLMIEGKIEKEGLVIQVVADIIHDYTPWLGHLHTTSRDFH
jgi:error-prone DNA polymerase